MRAAPPQPAPEPLYILRGHRAAVQCVAFLPNCRSLAAGDGEGELKLWGLDSRRVADSVRAHESHSGILQVACPSSSPCVVTQGRDGVVKCWQLHSGSSLARQPLHLLASGSFSFCRFALLEPGQASSSSCLPAQAGAQPGPTTQLVQPPPGSRCCATGVVVEGFRAAPGSSAGGDDGLNDRQASAAASCREASAAAAPRQHTLQGLLSLQLAQQEQLDTGIRGLSLNGAPGLAAAVADAGSSGAGGSSEDGPSGRTAADLTEEAEERLVLGRGGSAGASSRSSSNAGAGVPADSAAQPAALSAAAAAAASAGGPCYLALPTEEAANLGIWQLGLGGGGGSAEAPGGPPVIQLKQAKAPGSPSRGLCMAVALLQPQGRPLHALTGHEDGSVVLWDCRNTSSCLAAQRLHTEPVMCLAAAADCVHGWSGSADDRLAAFDISIEQGQLRAGQHQQLPNPGLADVAVRPDGRIAATAGWDGKVRVWHMRKRAPLAILRWHSQQVACVGFSSDSQLLAAGARDNCISLWSVYPPGR